MLEGNRRENQKITEVEEWKKHRKAEAEKLRFDKNFNWRKSIWSD